MTDAKKLIGDIFGSDSDDDDEEPVNLAEGEDKDDSDDSDSDAAATAALKGKQAFVSSLEEEHSDEELGDGVARVEKQGPRNDGAPLDLEAPLLPPPEDDSTMKLFRLSNILHVETKPFDPQRFEEEDTSYVDASGERRTKLFQNVVRWRHGYTQMGEPVKESNARFVRWSDGSVQLLLGDEVLDVTEQDTSKDKAKLYVRHPGLIQCLGNLKSKLIFRPSSLNSKSHKHLTAIVDKKHAKVNKLRKMLTTVDPEVEKVEREKMEEERIRNRMDLQRKQETVMERGGYNSGQRGFSSSYLEEEEEEEAMAREDEDARERRILNAKREAPAASGRKRAQQYEETDSEEELASVRPRGKGKARANISDDDDDMPVTAGARKRSRNVRMGSDEDSD